MKIHWFTPRKIGWLAVVAAVAWFTVSAPKSPQQFYAAACRDQEGSAAFTRFDALNQAMRRLELERDCQTNPAYVRANRTGVLLGAYRASDEAAEWLQQHNAGYRALSAELAQLLADPHNSIICDETFTVSGIPPARVMQAMFWRNFQAVFFWPQLFNRNLLP